MGNEYWPCTLWSGLKVAKITTTPSILPMALLSILQYPDPRLNIVAKPVQAVDARIKALVTDMIETMHDAAGIGLAATQINVHERVIVIDVSEEHNQPLVL